MILPPDNPLNISEWESFSLAKETFLNARALKIRYQRID
jgi:hypothetical protein